MYKKIIIVLLSGIFISCAATNCQQVKDLKAVVPINSFVKIEKKLTLERCMEYSAKGTSAPKSMCQKKSFRSSASGAVIKRAPNGSFVLTAAHVCDDAYIRSLRGVSVVDYQFSGLTLDMASYKVKVLEMDRKNDICIVWAQGLTDLKAVEISEEEPQLGDVAYNVAAPMGVFGRRTVPIFSGYFSGGKEGASLYSIAAIGGSSGSPIFNSEGKLIGLIHSAYINFPMLSISPTYKDLISFIDKTIYKHKAKYVGLNLLEKIERAIDNINK